MTTQEVLRISRDFVEDAPRPQYKAGLWRMFARPEVMAECDAWDAERIEGLCGDVVGDLSDDPRPLWRLLYGICRHETGYTLYPWALAGYPLKRAKVGVAGLHDAAPESTATGLGQVLRSTWRGTWSAVRKRREGGLPIYTRDRIPHYCAWYPPFGVRAAWETLALYGVERDAWRAVRRYRGGSVAVAKAYFAKVCKAGGYEP